MKQSGIYTITHVESGRQYVGSSSDTRKRFHDHRKQLNEGTHNNNKLQGSWNKHGQKAFRFDILLPVIEPTKLLSMEQHYIDTLRPFYNLAPIAGSMLGYKHTVQSLQKMSVASTGRKHSEEARAKMSASRTGSSVSKETKEKISAAIQGSVRTVETRQKIAAARLGQKAGEETRKKISAIAKARPKKSTTQFQ